MRAIHDLDIQDKHRALILTGRSMNIRLEATHSLTDPNVNSLAVEGDVDLVFPEFSPLAGEDVIRTLEQLMQRVVDIIEAFSKLVASRQ